jgi:transcriptional regulator with XRE-family HTH domain
VSTLSFNFLAQARKFMPRNALARKIGRVKRTPSQILGRNARTIRDSIEPKLSRKGLEDRCGVDQQSIADIEGGKYEDYGILKVVRVAKGLKVSVDDLLAGVDADYERYRRVLPRHGGTGQTVPPEKAGASDPPETQARALQERISALEDELAAAHELIRQFGKLADNARTKARDPRKPRS